MKHLFSKVKNDAFFSISTDIGFLKKPMLMKRKFKKDHGFDLIPSLYHPVVISWVVKNCGFGEIKFYQDGNKIYCDNECKDKDFIKTILSLIVDKAILTEKPFRRKRSSKREPRCRAIKKSSPR